MHDITISLTGLIRMIAEFLRTSGIIGKVGAWIGSLSVSSLLVCAALFGGGLKNILSMILTVFLVLVVLTFLSQSGALPAWCPVFTW